jgi:hypothetical protein
LSAHEEDLFINDQLSRVILLMTFASPVENGIYVSQSVFTSIAFIIIAIVMG